MQGLEIRRAEALDIERVPRHEVLEPLDGLSGADQPARAAARGFGLAGLLVDLAHRMAAAGRAAIRKGVRLRAARPALEDHSHDLRNHVARALHDHRVADPHVLARDFLLVVQRRIRDDDAADRDRLELRDRREHARAADLDLDVL